MENKKYFEVRIIRELSADVIIEGDEYLNKKEVGNLMFTLINGTDLYPFVRN